MPHRTRIAVIGVGNEFRCDDGPGRVAIDWLREWFRRATADQLRAGRCRPPGGGMSAMCPGIPAGPWRSGTMPDSACHGRRRGRATRGMPRLHTDDRAVGMYVIVHVGSAITEVDEAEGEQTLAVLRAMAGAVEAELGGSLRGSVI
ncbi:hypothetical protein GCM10010277_73230 [Streptomyces longisporoflavus]|nr:hypothetical protein GCM10010277_73230 [Streptomyces longisporoflavus]